jgi:hypothetical protein
LISFGKTFGSRFSKKIKADRNTLHNFWLHTLLLINLETGREEAERFSAGMDRVFYATFYMVASSPVLASEAASRDGFFPALTALGFSPCLRTQCLDDHMTALRWPISGSGRPIRGFLSAMRRARSNTASKGASLVLLGRRTAV